MRATIWMVLACATPAAATPPDPADAFGARNAVNAASISPDGSKVALIAAGPGRSDQLFVLDAVENATPRRILVASGAPERLQRCEWVSNTRLACRVAGRRMVGQSFYDFSSVVAVNSDGSGQRLLSTRRGENALYADTRGGAVIDLLPAEDGAVLMMRSYVPEAVAGSNIERRARGMGVDRVDTRTGAARRVEAPNAEAVEYITDGKGAVRIMGVAVSSDTGYSKGITRYLYKDLRGEWRRLSEFDGYAGTGFNPYAVGGAGGESGDVAYGLEKVDGRQALVSLSLDGQATRRVLVQHAAVDVDGLIRIGRTRRVVGATYETDRRVNVYFDPDSRAQSIALGKALGRNAWIVDASVDERRLLLWAGGDTDPGRYYLYDKTAKRLSPIISERPQLADTTLAEVRPVTYAAADGTRIPAYLTLPKGGGKGLPAIVMPHGGPDARDYWGFDWLAQYFVSRGFAVLQPNFRGSAGYGDAWRGQNAFKGWRTTVGDVADGGAFLVREGIADPARLGVLGWSYGGYAALQSAVVRPDLFKAVVAIAPVTDFATLVSAMQGSGAYYLERERIGTGPHVREGSPAQNAAAFTAPVLMFHGTQDANVPLAQARLMDDRLRGAGKASELVVFEGLDHQLDDGAARGTMLRRAAEFLAAAGREAPRR